MPDLFMDDINVTHIDEAKFVAEHTLGESSFGAIQRGQYNGKTVAMKNLYKRKSLKLVR